MFRNLLRQDREFAAMFGPLPRSVPIELADISEPESPKQTIAPIGIADPLPVVNYEDVISAVSSYSSSVYDGDKWGGGFGATEFLTADYYTLRARSAQLFETNLYARGLLRRLVTNEINTGLNLECSPIEAILGKEADSLEDWSEDVENRFELWGRSRENCDAREEKTWGQLQRQIRFEALVVGDVLITLPQDQRTGLPRVRITSGTKIRTPFPEPSLPKGSRIVHGVELDAQKRHVAYWVEQEDGTSKRIAAWGEKSGRRMAWLVYGTEKREDEIRGKPLLSLVLQALRDLDRYQDATVRKAVINSIVAMFIERKEAVAPSMGITAGGAVRKGAVAAIDGDGKKRKWNGVDMMPGTILETLEPGETVKPGTLGGADANLPEFTTAILSSIALAYQMPPEIFTLRFASNYSASRAALNEFDAYIFMVRTEFGEQVCTPIYVEWFVASVLIGKITALGFLEAWRDPSRYDECGAWTFCDWNGHIKASVDPLKMMNGYKVAIAEGAMTRDRMARETGGMKHSRVARKLRKENERMAYANEPILALEAKLKAPPKETSRNGEQQKSSNEKEGDAAEDPADDTSTDE